MPAESRVPPFNVTISRPRDLRLHGRPARVYAVRRDADGKVAYYLATTEGRARVVLAVEEVVAGASAGSF
jgi:hypothetical protein